MRRLLPLAPLALALACDGAGLHRLAFYLLLLAIPASVVAGLDRFAAALDGEASLGQALTGGLVVVLVVLSEAARGPHLAENAAPALALSTLSVALVIVAVQGLRALVGTPFRLALRPPASS